MTIRIEEEHQVESEDSDALIAIKTFMYYGENKNFVGKGENSYVEFQVCYTMPSF